MVSVRRMSMKGFKSFGRNICMDFPPGFTAIVGPNGSGKSNVVDALCFVLGRMSVKSLRADRLHELIFNGGTAGKPASKASVSITFDNTEGELPFPEKEVEVVREILKDGKSAYIINGTRTTRTQIVDVLSKIRVNPNGHNIILQGDVARVIDMNAVERREIVDDVSGIGEYEEKKIKALRELEKVQQKISEAEAVHRERKKYLTAVEREKDDAERYKATTARLKHYRGEIFSIKIKKSNKELGSMGAEYLTHVESQEKISEKINARQEEVNSLQGKINEIDEFLSRQGESKYAKEISDAKVSISSLSEKRKLLVESADSAGKEVKSIEDEISAVAEAEKESKVLIEKLRKERLGLEGKLNAKRSELAQLRKKAGLKPGEDSEKEEITAKITEHRLKLGSATGKHTHLNENLKALASELKSLLSQVSFQPLEGETTQQRAARAEAEYASLGKSLVSKKRELDSLKKRLGLEEVPSIAEEEVKKPAADVLEEIKAEVERLDALLSKGAGELQDGADISALKKRVKSFLSDVSRSVSSIKSKVGIVSDEDKRRKESLLRLGALSGEVSGLLSRSSSMGIDAQALKKAAAIEPQLQQLKSELASIDSEAAGHRQKISELEEARDAIEKASKSGLEKLEAASSEVERLVEEKNGLDVELSGLISKSEVLSGAKQKAGRSQIEKLQARISGAQADISSIDSQVSALGKRLKELEAKSKSESLETKLDEKKSLLSKIDGIRRDIQELYRKTSDVERHKNDLNVRKATVQTRLQDLTEEFKKYEIHEVEPKHTELELERLIQKNEKELAEIGSVNMLAIEAYEEIKKDYDELVSKMNKLTEEKAAVESFMHEIEDKKREAFMETFLQLLDNFETLYSKLDPGGEAHLVLENPDNPFEAGMDMQVRPRGKEMINVSLLSGGEKTLTALAFIFAIQQFRPAPFYILDEVDAALDKVNSDMLGKMLAESAKGGNAQFIVITHNDSVLEKADRLYGVSMTDYGSQIVGVEMGA
ncbi:MAG: chromosome segregation SMC family protein [archaeon]